MHISGFNAKVLLFFLLFMSGLLFQVNSLYSATNVVPENKFLIVNVGAKAISDSQGRSITKITLILDGTLVKTVRYAGTGNLRVAIPYSELIARYGYVDHTFTSIALDFYGNEGYLLGGIGQSKWDINYKTAGDKKPTVKLNFPFIYRNQEIKHRM